MSLRNDDVKVGLFPLPDGRSTKDFNKYEVEWNRTTEEFLRHLRPRLTNNTFGRAHQTLRRILDRLGPILTDDDFAYLWLLAEYCPNSKERTTDCDCPLHGEAQ